MAEPDNLVLAILREMRAEMDRGHEEVQAQFAAVNDRLDAMQTRLDAMHQNGIKALKGLVGHRAMIERTVASFEIDGSELKRQVEALEAAQS